MKPERLARINESGYLNHGDGIPLQMNEDVTTTITPFL